LHYSYHHHHHHHHHCEQRVFSTKPTYDATKNHDMTLNSNKIKKTSGSRAGSQENHQITTSTAFRFVARLQQRQSNPATRKKKMKKENSEREHGMTWKQSKAKPKSKPPLASDQAGFKKPCHRIFAHPQHSPAP